MCEEDEPKSSWNGKLLYELEDAASPVKAELVLRGADQPTITLVVSIEHLAESVKLLQILVSDGLRDLERIRKDGTPPTT